jgi:hypothetical protein
VNSVLGMCNRRSGMDQEMIKNSPAEIWRRLVGRMKVTNSDGCNYGRNISSGR